MVAHRDHKWSFLTYFQGRVRLDEQNNVSLMLNKDTMSDDEGVWVKMAKAAAADYESQI